MWCGIRLKFVSAYKKIVFHYVICYQKYSLYPLPREEIISKFIIRFPKVHFFKELLKVTAALACSKKEMAFNLIFLNLIFSFQKKYGFTLEKNKDCKTCSLILVADYEFYRDVGQGSIKKEQKNTLFSTTFDIYRLVPDQ